jgi:hypothetical protein
MSGPLLVVTGTSIANDMATMPRQERDAGWWADREATIAEERQHEAEWARVDQQLRGIAARRAALDAEGARLLRYAEELKLWRAYGFGSLLEYMERAMGYAPRTAAERLRVARALAELPMLADALEHGELAHSAVRELSRVAVLDTEAAWLEAAGGKSLREIEAMVSGHRPGDLPTDPTEPRLHRRTITLDVSPETYDIWRKLHALAAEEHGQRLSDDELILSLYRRAYSEDTASNSTGTGPGTAGTAGTVHSTSIVSAAGTVHSTSIVSAAGNSTGTGPDTAGAAGNSTAPAGAASNSTAPPARPARPPTRSHSSNVRTANVRGSTLAAATSKSIRRCSSAPPATPSTSARSTPPHRSARPPASHPASASRSWREMAIAAPCPVAAGSSGSTCTTSSIRAAGAATH